MAVLLLREKVDKGLGQSDVGHAVYVHHILASGEVSIDELLSHCETGVVEHDVDVTFLRSVGAFDEGLNFLETFFRLA
jgi:hypothetical protein